MRRSRLGVNIDHIATVRQARGEFYPKVKQGAIHSLEAGADQITIHLREDRRHIQDFDVREVQRVTKDFNALFNLEIGAAEEIVSIALSVKPDWLCLVPENREERTTEGGLDLSSDKQFNKIKKVIEQFRVDSPETRISLFVEADIDTLKRCKELSVDAVEIHTGEYAKDLLEGKDFQAYLNQFKLAKDFCESTGLGFHAGHGLTDESLKPLVYENLFEEYNIGHWIIADSIFCGLKPSIKKLLTILDNGQKV